MSETISIFNKLGFKENPFAYTNADQEEYITEYFVPPPYFEAIQGDYKSPNSSVVLAPRGSGKTAQRRMIEEWSKDKPVLSVTIDRFEFSNNQELKDITLVYHLKNIITNTLLNLTLSKLFQSTVSFDFDVNEIKAKIIINIFFIMFLFWFLLYLTFFLTI